MSLLVLSACTHFEPRPLQPEAIAEQYDSLSLNDAELRAFLQAHAPKLAEPWPRPSWDLSALTLAAFHFNTDLQLARAQWETAVAAVAAAAMRPNPVVNLIPGYNVDAQSGTPRGIPGMSVDIPIETAGKRRIRISKTEHLAEAARLNFIGAAWQVRSELRSVLIELTAAQRRLTLLQEQLVIQQRVVDLLQQRFTLGAASAAELSPARVALTRLQVDLAESERQQNDARNNLARALGVPLHALAGASFAFVLDLVPVIDVAQSRRQALHYRADIAAGLAEYVASEADLQTEIAKQYPDLRLGPAYQWDQGESKWSLGIGLELPLNRNQGAIAQAEAQRAESAARFRALETSVIAQIDRASAAHRVAIDQVTRARALHEATENGIARQETRLRVGDIDQLEYQTAKLEAAVSAVAVLDSEAQAAQAAGKLEDALQQPLAEIDALGALHGRAK
ncbi:TolC family protein [Steroidobacter cummioxidans]|uniref:TolC family protein n=1 Tax=Steroidobacter cummioxidans TaxID=1803913 RepID=UPI00137B89EF|nr:TolC family protein [Steroidobacter cummioxidans]